MTVRAKLLRTSTFRLAALYLILFAVSVSALLGYVYWNTAVLLQEQTDYTIQAEVQGLADQYRLRGLNGILDTVQRRSSNDSRSVYLLADPSGQRIAGNLTSLPNIPDDESGWIEFPLDVGNGATRERRAHEAWSRVGFAAPTPPCSCDAPDGPHALVCARVLGAAPQESTRENA